jgi:hypothetical protein
MTIDPDYLRQHYAQLTDEALLELHRADLVDAAQQCYDDELRNRGLLSRGARPADARPKSPQPVSANPQPVQVFNPEDKPEWFDDAAEALSRYDQRGYEPAGGIVDAQQVLEAAGIPCYVDRAEIPKETMPQPTHVWRLLVPGDVALRANSVIERDISNPEFEAGWKTHLEMLSDEELLAMDPEVTFCGLFDKVERVTKTFDEELTRRRLK